MTNSRQKKRLRRVQHKMTAMRECAAAQQARQPSRLLLLQSGGVRLDARGQRHAVPSGPVIGSPVARMRRGGISESETWTETEETTVSQKQAAGSQGAPPGGAHLACTRGFRPTAPPAARSRRASSFARSRPDLCTFHKRRATTRANGGAERRRT